jgi:broad specificity phosphatase PhoE
MPTLYLVRHGQASFGAEDYDHLSELGVRQCAALGEYLHARGRRFDGVVRGSLRRHEQSLVALARTLPGLPAAQVLPALDEYDAHGIARTVAGAAGAPAPQAGTSQEARREHFRLLREGLDAWMAGTLSVPGMPSWREFDAGVAAALEHIRKCYAGDVLMVSSGGPISTAVAQVLGAPAPSVVALNLQMRNSALTEFVFTPRRHLLVTFNTLPHLDHPQRSGWVTFS